MQVVDGICPLNAKIEQVLDVTPICLADPAASDACADFMTSEPGTNCEFLCYEIRAGGLGFSREWNRRSAFSARRQLFQVGARLVSPGAVGRVPQIRDPLDAREVALAALFIR